MNANKRKCIFGFARNSLNSLSILISPRKKMQSTLASPFPSESGNNVDASHQYDICVYLRDAQGCANAAGAGCARAAQFADFSFAT